MHEYRKKPVVVEAFQMTEQRRDDNSEWPSWLNEAWGKDPRTPGALYQTDAPGRLLAIGTLEGEHTVSWGDWIIRGVQGELYPCKPDIFEATYQAATDNPAGDPGPDIIEVILDRAITASGSVHVDAIQGLPTEGSCAEGILHALVALALVQHERLVNAAQLGELMKEMQEHMGKLRDGLEKPAHVIHEIRDPRPSTS